MLNIAIYARRAHLQIKIIDSKYVPVTHKHPSRFKPGGMYKNLFKDDINEYYIYNNITYFKEIVPDL
jgi:hypothetical protein